MKERQNNVESTNYFNSSIKQIILEMDMNRGRIKNLSSEEIDKKIYSKDGNKPGELLEFMEEYAISEGRLTTELALEMADIIYYTSQPNCSKKTRKLSNYLEKMVGINHEEAQQFCILKYRCRLEQPIDYKGHKQEEYQAITQFLNHKKLNFLP